MRLPIFLAIVLGTVGGSALAKECRMPDVPPGVRVQLPPGCKDPLEARRLEAQRQESLKANQGFVDLGNGTQVRIGGRVRAEVGGRR